MVDYKSKKSMKTLERRKFFDMLIKGCITAVTVPVLMLSKNKASEKVLNDMYKPSVKIHPKSVKREKGK
jgi:hypothetical protein